MIEKKGQRIVRWSFISTISFLQSLQRRFFGVQRSDRRVGRPDQARENVFSLFCSRPLTVGDLGRGLLNKYNISYSIAMSTGVVVTNGGTTAIKCERRRLFGMKFMTYENSP